MGDFMSNYLSKAKKRKLKEQDKGIVEFAKICIHFFKDFEKWIDEMVDPRNQSYVTYKQCDLVILGLMKNVCSIESMRQMEEKFNEETCIETFKILTGNKDISEIPHYDTLNYYLEKLSPECLDELRRKMIRNLIRSKAFNNSRLFGDSWRIILDGTGLFHFKERHCENCLKTTKINEDGTKTTSYYHKVLEAKIILADNIVISLGTEFIENENEDVAKQDCEQNAAKRLLNRIKKQYPRLNICILGDSLYAAQSIMGICRKHNWKYILNCKSGSQKNIIKDYEYIKSAEDTSYRIVRYKDEEGTSTYVNHVEDVTGKDEVFNIFEYEYKDKKKSLKFTWITNIEINDRNLEETVNAGRSRWKIENEGFNNQKNGLYRIEHLNSKNSTAMKNHYLLTQIADILMQLYIVTNKLIKKIKQSIKNTSSRLLESFRRQTVTDEDVYYLNKRTTVRLL